MFLNSSRGRPEKAEMREAFATPVCACRKTSLVNFIILFMCDIFCYGINPLSEYSWTTLPDRGRIGIPSIVNSIFHVKRTPISPAYEIATYTLKNRNNPLYRAFVCLTFRPSSAPAWHTSAAWKPLVKSGSSIIICKFSAVHPCPTCRTGFFAILLINKPR